MFSRIARHRLHLTLLASCALLVTLVVAAFRESAAFVAAEQLGCSCAGDPVPAKCINLCEFGLQVEIDGNWYCTPPCEWFGSQGRLPTASDFEEYYADPDCFTNLTQACKDAIISEWTKAMIDCCGEWDWAGLGCNFDGQGGIDCGDLESLIADMDDLKSQGDCPGLTREEIIKLTCCFIAHCGGQWTDYCTSDLKDCLNGTGSTNGILEDYGYSDLTDEEWEDFQEECTECCCQETSQGSGVYYSDCGTFDCDRDGDMDVDCDDIKDFLDDALQCEENGGELDADDVAELICKFLEECPTAFDCNDLQTILDCACEWLGQSLTQEQAEKIAQCIDSECHADLCEDIDGAGQETLNFYNGNGDGSALKCDLDCDGDTDCEDLKEFIRLSRECNGGSFTQGQEREEILKLICKFMEELSTCDPNSDLCDELYDCMEDIFRQELGEEEAQVTQEDVDWLNDPQNCDLQCDVPFDGPGENPDPICEEDCEEQCTGGDARSVNVYGHKTERIPVFTIPVNGQDFPFTLEYSSNTAYDGSGYIGYGFTASPMRFVRYDDTNDIFGMDGYAPGTVFQTGVDDVTDHYKIHGPTTLEMDRTTADFFLDGQTYAVWRVSDPGRIITDYYRDDTGVGGGVVDIDDALIGLPLQMQDEYGNVRTYSYVVYPKTGGGTVARLSNIRFWPKGSDPDTDRPDAELRFRWMFTGDAENLGRLRLAYVVRYDGSSPVVTHIADLTYMDPNKGHAQDLGKVGDLVQLTVFTRIDRDLSLPSGSEAFRPQVTQFRYHGGATPGGGGVGTGLGSFSGSAHQLKMIIMPEQIEYGAQKVYETSTSTGSLLGYANSLLKLDDGDVAFVDDPGTGSDEVILSEMAAKVISEYYDTGLNGVKTQFIQSACGCGGGSTQGLKLTYDYYTYGGTPATDWTTRIKELIDDGAGGYDLHRVLFYDSKLLPSSGTEQKMPFLVNRAVLDDTNGDGDVDAGEDVWVTHYDYDTNRNVSATSTPEAMSAYTDGTSSAASYTAKTSDGLIYTYSYTTENRLQTTSVKQGSGGTPKKVTTITYDSTREWLPTKIERFRTDDNPTDADKIEVTEFDYGFHTTGTETTDIAWIETEVEAELVGENGPGGTYLSYELFDAKGNNIYSIAGDDCITKRFFDADTARVTKVIRNASNDLGASYHGLTTSGFGRNSDGGSLTTEYKRDDLGRVIERISPSLVSTYTMREMRTWPERPGITYYAEVTLPHLISATNDEYDGPVTLTWYNGDDDVIGTMDHSVGSGDYTFTGGTLADWDEDGGAELARASIVHDISGLVEERSVWHTVPSVSDPDGEFYTAEFTYDKLGRLATTIDPLSTYTKNTYDILDRVTQVDVGTSDANLLTVAIYEYDGGAAGNSLLTEVTQKVDSNSSNDRVTSFAYDWRDRLIKVTNPLPPNRFIVYDNLDRVVEEALFETTGTSWDNLTDIDDSSTRAERGLYKKTEYSQRGLVYAQSIAIDPNVAKASMTFLGTHRWYDQVGRTSGGWSPNSPMTKTTFDGLGRPDVTYITDRGGDADPGSAGNHGDVYDATNFEAKVNGDVVLEERQYSYHSGSTPATNAGMLYLVSTNRRAHDVSDSDKGALSDLASAKSIITYTGTEFDAADRVIASINFGTNQTNDEFKHGGSAPSTSGDPPTFTTSGFELETAMTYNVRGLVDESTDPEGQVTKYLYDDLNRTFAVIENYVDATVTWNGTAGCWEVDNIDDAEPDTDRVTSFVYDGNNNVTIQIAHRPDTNDADDPQKTIYTYGVTEGAGSTDSRINHNGLLKSVEYPDTEAGNEDTVFHAYNRLGETRWMQDQNGSQHTYTRDKLGRVTVDAGVKAGSGPGADIDDTIDSIELSYDNLGRVDEILSKDSTTVINGVKFTYTKLWQIDLVWQDVDGNTFSGSTPKVDYDYDDNAVNDGNWSRMTKITYPDGESFTYNYTGTANSAISRLFGIYDNSGISLNNEVEYGYIGLSMTAEVDLVRPDVQLDYQVKHNGARTSGEYAGYDRFGRVINHPWVDGNLTTHATDNTVPNIPPIVELDYVYDKASNRTKMLDSRPGASQNNRDMVYTYDGLHRLDEALRGVDGGTFAHAPGSERWSLDMLGNWDTLETDNNGDGDYLDSGESEDRTHNDVNELTKIGANDDLTYDHSGNLREQETGVSTKRRFTHDLWNRLVKVEHWNGTSWSTLGEYEYYGTHWRSIKKSDTDGSGGVDELRQQYYSAGWQLIEERIDDSWTSGFTKDRAMQYLWGARYIDDIVMHREDHDGDGSFTDTGSLRWWHLTDVQFSTIANLDDSANVAERVRYDSYGRALHHEWRDVDGDRDYDSTDRNIIGTIAAGANNSIGQSNYKVEADLNRDGVIDLTDVTLATTNYVSALPAGDLSNSTVKNTIGWDGYIFNPECGLYHVRFRWYSPDLGRWLERDPVGYRASMNFYVYVRSRPFNFTDPTGLFPFGDPLEWFLRQYIEPVFNTVVNEIDQAASAVASAAGRAWLNLCAGINAAMSNPFVECGCFIAGTADIFPPFNQNPIVETVDCACNVLTTVQTLCNSGVGWAAAYGTLTAIDCLSLIEGAKIGGGIGGAIGGPIGAAAGASIGDILIDVIAAGLQNLIVQGTPLPVSQCNACITVIKKLAPPPRMSNPGSGGGSANPGDRSRPGGPYA